MKKKINMREEEFLNYLTLVSGVIVLGILLFLAYYSQFDITPVEVLVLVFMMIPFIFFGFLFICGMTRLLINLIIFLRKRSKRIQEND